MSKVNKLMISVDVEEFDIPLEFGGQVPLREQLSVSHDGLMKVLDLFERYQVRATFFITAYWAQHYPELVRQLAARHEVASHTYYHSDFAPEHLESSRLALQDITGMPVYGFRMPRLKPVSTSALKNAGYLYDASLNPTWLPGRYNNWDKPRTPFQEDGLWVMPSSVSPLCRYPVFWLSIKNMPGFVTRHFSNTILRKDRMLASYFHPWELADLSGYTLPGYIRRVSGSKMQQRLNGFLQYLRQKGEFCTHIEWLRDRGVIDDGQVIKF